MISLNMMLNYQNKILQYLDNQRIYLIIYFRRKSNNKKRFFNSTNFPIFYGFQQSQFRGYTTRKSLSPGNTLELSKASRDDSNDPLMTAGER